MDPIFQKLLQSCCMDKKYYLEKKDYIEDISHVRADFLNVLEQKNDDVKKSWKELHEKELKLMTEVKGLIQTSEFKRAYLTSGNQAITKRYLGLLEGCKIESTKGLEELKRIKSYIQNQIDQQIQIDQKNLNNIKKQVGSKVWNDFQHHFQSDEFLQHYR